jgi:hypothetical protein
MGRTLDQKPCEDFTEHYGHVRVIDGQPYYCSGYATVLVGRPWSREEAAAVEAAWREEARDG